MTRIGKRPKQGDIVLIPVPFTELSSSKRCPVIVISNDHYNQSTPDMIVVAMTSNPTSAGYSFVLTNMDLEQGQLNRSGTVRVDRMYTLEQTLIVKVFGRVSSAILDRVHATLISVTSYAPPSK